jgi:hypothetical protein
VRGEATTFRAISGAALSANVSTPLSTFVFLLLPDESSAAASSSSSGFESSESFAAVQLQSVPRFPSGPICAPANAGGGFLSGPIERGFLSAPLDAALMSGPLPGAATSAHMGGGAVPHSAGVSRTAAAACGILPARFSHGRISFRIRWISARPPPGCSGRRGRPARTAFTSWCPRSGDGCSSASTTASTVPTPRTFSSPISTPPCTMSSVACSGISASRRSSVTQIPTS